MGLVRATCLTLHQLTLGPCEPLLLSCLMRRRRFCPLVRRVLSYLHLLFDAMGNWRRLYIVHAEALYGPSICGTEMGCNLWMVISAEFWTKRIVGGSFSMGDSGRKACLSQARRGNRDRKGRMMGMEATEDHREASDKEIRRNGFGVWICNRAEKIKQAQELRTTSELFTGNIRRI